MDDVPFIETILHRNVASRWDPVARENESVERERRARVGVYTHKTSGADRPSESDPRSNDTYAAHEWEFTRQGYADGLRGDAPETRRGFLVDDFRQLFLCALEDAVSLRDAHRVQSSHTLDLAYGL